MKLLNHLISQSTTTILSWLYWIRETCENNTCSGCPLEGRSSGLIKCRVRNLVRNIGSGGIPKSPDLWNLPKLDITAVAPNSLDFILKLPWNSLGNPILKLGKQGDDLHRLSILKSYCYGRDCRHNCIAYNKRFKHCTLIWRNPCLDDRIESGLPVDWETPEHNPECGEEDLNEAIKWWQEMIQTEKYRAYRIYIQ